MGTSTEDGISEIHWWGEKKKRTSEVCLDYEQQIDFINPVSLSVFLTAKQLSKWKM